MKPTDLLTTHLRILPIQATALKRLGIQTVEDLLYHFPVRYGDTAKITHINTLSKGDHAVVFGRITGLKTSKGFRTKIPMSEAYVDDETGKMKIVWFHQAYLAKMLVEGSLVRVDGKVGARKDQLYFSNPKIEAVTKIPIGVGDSLFGASSEEHTLYPVYPETKGITSNWILHKIQAIFSSGLLDSLVDPIPSSILDTYNLPDFKTALIYIHTPKKLAHAESARKRFAFEEIFFIQLEKQKTRAEFKEKMLSL
ncbi:hypothetical protein BH11PAT3_BH11PAT3_1680 [soil metagenome]